ncbi:hypothetical protein ACHAWF_007968 [Thalassiosira exigua]
MAVQVVHRSSFSFETDLPHASILIHPSGVLHAFRTTPSADDGASPPREEHVFAWLEDALHMEAATAHLKRHGFGRGAKFLPYSTLRNWTERYPHAAPAMEVTGDGEVKVYLNYRPYLNGLGGSREAEVDVEVEAAPSETDGGHSDEEDEAEKEARAAAEKKERQLKSKRRADRKRYPNMVGDPDCLLDAERDELHVEIYTYLKWLQNRLEKVEDKAAKKAVEDEDDEGAAEEKRQKARQWLRGAKGYNPEALEGVLRGIEATFSIIPRVHLKRQADGCGEEGKGDNENDSDDEGKATDGGGDGDDDNKENAEDGGKKGKKRKRDDRMNDKKDVPFLEEALRDALERLVEARGFSGRTRRSRRRLKEKSTNPKWAYDRKARDFEEMFEKLRLFAEEQGHCLPTRKDTDHFQVFCWVKNLRFLRQRLQKRGIDHEEDPPPGKRLNQSALTTERIARLDALGFAWNPGVQRTHWDVRYRELVEWHKLHGGWPSQASVLGRWVAKQRKKYAQNDEDFMKEKAPLLDEIDFEWTPRGNTRMSWEEGFELLIAFGEANGHYNVPKPPPPDGASKDRFGTSDERRFYVWVESLHKMHR